jgi:uncharacterized membrane protein
MARSDQRSARVPAFDWILAMASAVLLVGLLVAPRHGNGSPYLKGLLAVSATLRGEIPHSDLAQDVYGFRALVAQRDPYPILGPALRTLGIDWDVKHASTHPPTCFLLLAPVACLPWNWASALWAWLMLGLLCLSFRCCGLRWGLALGLTPFALLWPPVATSLGQVTIVWLFGLTAAYHCRQSSPFRAGLGIGLAALTKLVPGVLVVVLLVRKQWRGVAGLALVWTLTVGVLGLMSPATFVQYLRANETAAPATLARSDNSALLATAFRVGGWPGLIAALAFLLLVMVASRRCFSRAADADAITRLWLLFMYLAVALLPVAWIYSVTPLLPVVLYLLSRGRVASLLTATAALAIPFVAPAGGEEAVTPLVAVTLLVGVGLILNHSTTPRSAANSGGSTLTATSRPRRESRDL